MQYFLHCQFSYRGISVTSIIQGYRYFALNQGFGYEKLLYTKWWRPHKSADIEHVQELSKFFDLYQNLSRSKNNKRSQVLILSPPKFCRTYVDFFTACGNMLNDDEKICYQCQKYFTSELELYLQRAKEMMDTIPQRDNFIERVPEIGLLYIK